jgi:gamma-glutamylcyclotransferase (GGCT)/AIG2-like uncharacterized protein YtfP
MLIFAYGSNMSTARLRARVPSARPLASARLDGHRLRFHKRGWRDGSGKADAAASSEPETHLWGVVFRIELAEKADLDRIEGLGNGYDEARLEVASPGGRRWHAWLYRAHASAVDADAIPFRWYRDLVLAGAREHGLPDDYIRRHIAGCPTRPDPDRDRALRHQRLLDRPARVPAGGPLER